MAERKVKFVVFKIEDLQKYFASRPEQRFHFQRITEGIAKQRETEGKNKYNKYVVCNEDEPYSIHIWKIILQGEDNKL